MAMHPRNNRTSDGAKKRWTNDDRARRDQAPGRPDRADRTQAPGNRAAKRTDRFGADRFGGAPRGERRDRDDAPRQGDPRQERRTDWYPGPRNSDRGRPARDGQGGGTRAGDDRPRNDRPREDRGRDDRAPRSFRADAPQRSSWRDRPAGDDRSREDRPRRTGERPSYGSANGDRQPYRDRPQRADRPAYGDRPERSDRPDRPYRGDRPTGERHSGDRDRPDRAPRADRSDRPGRDDRTPREDRPQYGRPQQDRPQYDRPARDRPQQDRPPYDRPARDRPQQDRFRDDRPRREPAGERRFGTHSDGPRHDTEHRHASGYAAPEDVVLEKLEAEVVTADEVADLSFADLGLGPRIVDSLAELGALAPFPIQAATIPDALDGRDVLGRGRTGSGKTIAFGAGLVERLMRNWAESGRGGSGRRMGRAPRAIVLAPTRELALQIDRTVQPIARAVGLFTTQIVGGVPFQRQIGALAKGVDIVIGTPGRIEDLQAQGRLDLSEIEIVVLDEADHMADLGFLEPIQRILRLVPQGGQRMLFSATLDSAVAALVAEFLSEPAVHEVAEETAEGTVRHRVLVIDQGDKLPVLTALLASGDRALVFARTRAFAEQLADELDDAGVRAESLHGDLNQSRRTRNLAKFTEGRVSALVATDVAARGIHVDDIALVVHADAAEDHKSYLHRSGRTGRAGASGTAVTLITERRRRRFTELLDRAGIEADFVRLKPGADPVEALAR